ncbi:hypothetical protein ACJIZ3_021762 [Penstemon smallii]|uniref:Uncharacterized protein n=1 Tax=Penstemon smallii TaxID=265156 RepID=A0ABD3SNB5_9LAMI
MPRQGHRGVMIPTKIRKRGCSSSSSTSSRIHNYRLNKRAILVPKNRVGLVIGSRSTTPVPTWRTTAIASPKYSQSGKSTQPVSARKLAATLWEMNMMPSPKMSESDLDLMKEKHKKSGSKMVSKREKMESGWRLHSGSGSFPSHLSDPSHSPTVSEKTDGYGTSSRRIRTPLISQRLRSPNQSARVFDTMSHASFMEIENRSRPPNSSGSVSGGKNRLKDISNALTTSKELLKIINRIWANVDQPSSSTSLISALHAELERARLQVNQLIQEQRADKNEINRLVKCFSEERASWKIKEEQAVESAIKSIAGELEVERKLRRRVESVNKKLGNELGEMKSSFINVVKELQSEKRAREITQQEEVEKEREMLEKLSEPRRQVEEKNSAIRKLRKHLDVLLGPKRDKDETRAKYLGSSNIGSHQNKQEDEEKAIDGDEDSAESDLHSIELNVNNNSNYKGAIVRESKKLQVKDEIKARNSVSGQASRRSTSLQRSVSDGVEWTIQGNRERLHELEKEAQRRSYFDETQRYKSSTSRLASAGATYGSPSRPVIDPGGLVQDRSSLKSRMADVRGEGHSARRSKW